MGVSGTNIKCLDDAGSINCNKVIWIQDDNFTFDTGSMSFENDVEFVGSYSFVYASARTSTIQSKSTWHINHMRMSMPEESMKWSE